MKNFFRKCMVSLKRKPHMIALIVFAIAFIWYSFNLTSISNTTALVNGQNMGLEGFVTMLFSVLSLVCFLNAFPHRKPVNKIMLILMFAMVALLIVCDVAYTGSINYALTRTEPAPIAITNSTQFVLTAKNVLMVHVIILCIGVALTALLPVYAPLIKRVNTSINIEGNDAMDKIDISGEDA